MRALQTPRRSLERGAAAIEYAVLIGLVSIAAIATVEATGTRISALVGELGAQLGGETTRVQLTQPPAPVVLAVGAPASLRYSAGDHFSGAVRSLSLSGLPAFLSVDEADGRLTVTATGTPGAGDVATTSATLTAVGPLNSASTPLAIAVLLPVSWPAQSSAYAVAVGDPLDVSLSPPSGTDITQIIATIPAGAQDWLSFDAEQLRFTGTPAANDVGTLTVSVAAGNAVSSDTTSFGITVEAAAAWSNPPSDDVATVGQPFSVILTVPDGTDLAVTADIPPAAADWLSFDDQAMIFSGTPAVGDVGTVTITLTASNTVSSESVSFDVTVLVAPTVAAALADVTVEEETALTPINVAAAFTGTGLSFQLAGLPSFASFDAASGQITGTPPAGSAGSSTITITATNAVGTASDSFTLTVEEGAETIVVGSGGAREYADGTRAQSCAAYLNPSAGFEYSGSTGDGLYRLASGDTVYCEMSGGGWTWLVGRPEYDSTGDLPLSPTLQGGGQSVNSSGQFTSNTGTGTSGNCKTPSPTYYVTVPFPITEVDNRSFHRAQNVCGGSTAVLVDIGNDGSRERLTNMGPCGMGAQQTNTYDFTVSVPSAQSPTRIFLRGPHCQGPGQVRVERLRVR